MIRGSTGPISVILPIPGLAEERRPSLRHLAAIRWGLLVAALLLCLIGLAMVHSASSELRTDFLPRQAVWVGMGIIVMVIAFSIDYHVLLGLSIPLYLVGLVGLVLIFFLGHRAGGARSWIGIGAFGGQPSEFAKLATCLLLARTVAGANRRSLSARQAISAVLVVAAPALLVAIEPDLGGAAMFVPMLVGVLLVAGVRPRILLGGALLLAVLGGALWSFGMREYQRQRVLTFLQPDRDPLGKGYQVQQGKIAVGSGGLLGKGYMQGTQSQLRFLPARHTDFIFAALAEEWGFLGVAVTLSLFGFYLWNGATIAMRARDRSGILLATGLLSLFAFHALYNTSMVVGLVPNTGIPLPFVSYGGSFMLLNFASTGLLLGVDFRRYVNR
ncbi:MAG: rod shape-determining protein RodA [Acidobacteriota bacterium]